MKRISMWFSILVVITICSCNDLLNKEPKTFVSGSSYFKTPAQIKLELNGAYSSLQQLFTPNPTVSNESYYWTMTEMRADNTTFQSNLGSGRPEHALTDIDTFLTQISSPAVQTVWQLTYRGISRCNGVLNHINGVKYSDPSLKERVIGQAKFLRAFYYFNLVRLYGGVPLVLKQASSPDQAFSSGRATKSEVYKQIIQDVSDAASKLPISYSGPDVGRATKGAAYTMLGIVYMTQKDYADAITAFKKVITMNKYSLVSNYADIFKPSNKNNSESIFEVQYNASLEGEASHYAYRFLPLNSGSDIIGFNDLLKSRAGYNIPTRSIIRSYEKRDKRKDASVSFYVKSANKKFFVALGDSIPYAEKFVHPFEQPGRTNEDFMVYRYAQVLLMNAEALNETGKTSKAYDYINKVRRRAGLDNLAGGMNQNEFRKAIYHEERVELVFENHRWFNLLRTGRAVKVMTEAGKEIRNTIIPAASYNIQKYKLLYPIPQRAVRVANLDQNSGW